MYAHLKKLFPEANNPEVLKHQVVTKLDILNELNLLVTELQKKNSDTHSKKWLKSTEVRKLLRISAGTLQNLRVNGTLSYTKVGGIIFYSYDEIQKVLEENQVNESDY